METLLYFVLLWSMVHGHTFNDVRRLQDLLFDGHDVSIRPVINQSSQIQIGVQLTLITIINFDMTNGRLETMGYLSNIWKDENLFWNETEFKNISRLTVSSGDVWSPDIAQIDATTEDKELSAILLQNDGTLIKSVAKPYVTFCDLDMRFYPIDEHVCTFEFVSVNYAYEDMKLVPLSTELDFSNLKPHGEWKVTGASINEKSRRGQGVDVQSVGIEFVYIFERQPGFTLLHQVIPLFVLKTADIFIHMVPLNSGERTSYAVTLLLAFVFWQAVVTEELPKNSANISILSVLITVSMIVSGFSTVSSVILCRVSSFDEDRPIPGCLQRFARMDRWNRKRFKKIQKAKNRENQQYNVKVASITNNHKKVRDAYQRGTGDVDKRIPSDVSGRETTCGVCRRETNDVNKRVPCDVNGCDTTCATCRLETNDVNKRVPCDINGCDSYDTLRCGTFDVNRRVTTDVGVDGCRRGLTVDEDNEKAKDAILLKTVTWPRVANGIDNILLMCNFVVSLLIIIAFVLIFRH